MVSVAWAQAAGESAFGGFEVLLPMVLVFVVFYFLLIRPQQRKVKAHQEKLSSIVKGDEILTGGGFYGKVVKAEGDDLWVRLAEGMEVQILRSTVMDRLEKGTIKAPAKKKTDASKTKKAIEKKATEKKATGKKPSTSKKSKTASDTDSQQAVDSETGKADGDQTDGEQKES